VAVMLPHAEEVKSDLFGELDGLPSNTSRIASGVELRPSPSNNGCCRSWRHPAERSSDLPPPLLPRVVPWTAHESAYLCK
jgi:hypothetical protein